MNKFAARLLAVPYLAVATCIVATIIALPVTALAVYLATPAARFDIIWAACTWFLLGAAWACVAAGRELRRMRREFSEILEGPPPEFWRENILAIVEKMRADGEIPPGMRIDIKPPPHSLH